MQNKVIPNSTQVPNVIIDDLMRKLKGSELRIVLVVVRLTFGWMDNRQTGRRKTIDWINHTQLRKKTGLKSNKVISISIARLVDKIGVIEALDEDGRLLNTPAKRMNLGGRIYYRFNLKYLG
jgi:hypothetical protein